MELTKMNYEAALEAFLATDVSYAGGLSNHGPMTTEALVSMGQEEWIGPFVAHYSERLEEPVEVVDAAPEAWAEWLGERLPGLIAQTGNLAGHGLLRVAHAVRGLERFERSGRPADVQLRELATAMRYWDRGGRGVDGPDALTGAMGAGDWGVALDRLSPGERSEGMLTVTLARAAATPHFHERIASLAPADDPADTLDALATAAAEAFGRNVGLPAFALLHGVTVSSMARQLLAHLDERDGRRLEAAVAGFVGAALVGFDARDTEAAPRPPSVPDPAQLARLAAETLEDHTIKFADACLGVAGRTGSAIPLIALDRQIRTPYGVPPQG